jgi:hypothetical protein
MQKEKRIHEQLAELLSEVPGCDGDGKYTIQRAISECPQEMHFFFSCAKSAKVHPPFLEH